MKNVLEYLELSASKYPNKTAFGDVDNSVTYMQLLKYSMSIGSYINKVINMVNRPVAVLLDKTAMSVAAFMGVVYSGNFYTVIDSHMPADRIKLILSTLNPEGILTDTLHSSLAEKLEYKGKVISFEKACEYDIDRKVLNEIRSNMIDTDPLYALFTSGSTGVPKGALLCHKNIISYTEWVANTFDFSSDTIFGNQTPFYFSMSVTDMYSTLKCGATLHIIPKQLFSFPVKLLEFISQRNVNTIYWVPSALCIIANWKMFDFVEVPKLNKILFAGEVMPTKQLNYWIKHLPNALFANLFGPTETTDICTYYIISRPFADDEALPIGKSCDNCNVFVLDDKGNKVTQSGVEGELYARGSFVAMGYYNNPQKTAQAFVKNPLCSAYPEFVYRTGDLVKYNDEGELVYVTRKDFQIKHMGYRIELGEIETAVSALSGIVSDVCVYDSAMDHIVLVYQGHTDDAKIANALKEKLPSYMIPDVFVKVKNMPHNRNGKIDRVWLRDNYKIAK